MPRYVYGEIESDLRTQPTAQQNGYAAGNG